MGITAKSVTNNNYKLFKSHLIFIQTSIVNAFYTVIKRIIIVRTVYTLVCM